MKETLVIREEVREALSRGAPVVALESSLICQGLPPPNNVEIAQKSERLLRDQGVIPATVAILEGKAHVGLSDQQLRWLADQPNVSKANLSNLAILLGSGQTGACTVSATIALASEAGIRVMATGGIGGVHRGAEESMDISSDLVALARCPMVVVSAGVKAVLDLPKTLESLETHGVSVVGWRTDEFPAFYSRTSGCRLETQVDQVREIAQVFGRLRDLRLPGGVLVANPVPAEAEIPASEIQPWIDAALEEAQAAGVRGKALTPFLLSRLEQLSGGRTLQANLAVIENNVKLAAEIARAMA